MIFEDWHLMLVLVIFMLVHCAKPLCERCIELEERLLACCHVASALSCARHLILWLCMLQPFFFSAAYMFKRAQHAPLQVVLVSSIVIEQKVLMNETLDVGMNMANSSQFSIGTTLSWQSTDYMFFVLPLALGLCWSTILWMHLSHAHILHEGLSWDTDIIEHVGTYEAVYCMEVLALNFASVGVTSHGRTGIEIFNLTVALTLLVVHCLSSAFVERDGRAEAWTTCAYAVVLVALMRNWWVEMLQGACMGIIFIAGVHTVAVTAVCWVHATANGQRLASTIIAVRALASLSVSLVLLVTYMLGWGAIC